MKPLQIGLLVLVGALGGALIMKFAQRPRPVLAPVAAAQPAPSPAPPAPVLAPEPAAAPQEPASIPDVDSEKPMRHAMSHSRAPAAPRHVPAHVPAPLPAPVTTAQNVTPAQPQTPAVPPSPIPVQEPVAPPVANEPAPTPEPAAAQPAESAAPPAPQPAPTVTLEAGLTLPVRLGESLSSEHNQAGDTFTASLDAPLIVGGFAIAEKGARVEGRVIEARKSGHGSGKARLALELTKVSTSDGQHVEIKTEIFRKEASSMAATDQAGIVAAAAGIGAVIGAIAGGGKGAAIGAGAGGAAGGGGVLATRDKAVALPTESKISFRLSAPVTLTEQTGR